MNRKLFIGLSLMVISIIFIYRISKILGTKKDLHLKIKNFPQLTLFKTDSVAFQFPTASVIVLIYFNSGCEHCKYELNEIRRNIQSFTKAEVILMSAENISEIKKVSENFELTSLPNIHFTKINSGDLVDVFGSVSVPHIFIYDKDRKLVKEFKGETKIEAILKFIP